MSRRQNTKRNNGKPRDKRRQKDQNLGRALIRRVEPKYLDVLSIANNIGAGGTLFSLSLVPQGDQQLQRVGDFIQPLKLIMNFSMYVVNADIVTTTRMIFFRWLPSTALVVPVIASILESPAAANVLSHYNFQNQDNYQVLLEKQFQSAGVVAAPTTSSSIGRTGWSIPLGRKPEIEFALGATSASNHLYMLVLSDSSVTPFPILNFSTRLYFEDTVRSGKPKGMPK